MKAKYVFIIAIAFFLTNCNSDAPNNLPDPNAIIEDQFMPFYLSFIEEMQARDVNLADDAISIISVETLSADNSGQYCAYGYPNFAVGGYARVEVIADYHCWNKRSYTEKENLMYHEFGHALLGRSHTFQMLPNGSVKSLMCSEICSNYGVYNAYQPEQRSYYLDELASAFTSQPSWATEKSFSRVLYQDDFDNSQDGWISTTTTENGIAQTNPFTFFIETNAVSTAPFALGISTVNNSETNSYGTWSKNFNLENFEYCSNIMVSADIKFENLISGNVAILVDLYDDTNSEVRFARYFELITSTEITSSNQYQNFEAIVTCLPLETSYVKVSLYLDAQSATNIYFDNLEINLYE